MADIQLNSVTLATESGGTVTLDSATSLSGVTIPAAGITGTMASAVTGIPAAGVTGVLPVGVTGEHICKVWCFIKEAASVLSIKDSFNVSGITDHSAGQATITFDTDMANVNYAFAGYSHYGGGTNDVSVVQVTTGDQLVGSLRIHNKVCINDGSTFTVLEFEEGMIIVFGDQ